MFGSTLSEFLVAGEERTGTSQDPLRRIRQEVGPMGLQDVGEVSVVCSVSQKAVVVLSSFAGADQARSTRHPHVSGHTAKA